MEKFEKSNINNNDNIITIFEKTANLKIKEIKDKKNFFVLII